MQRLAGAGFFSLSTFSFIELERKSEYHQTKIVSLTQQVEIIDNEIEVFRQK